MKVAYLQEEIQAEITARWRRGETRFEGDLERRQKEDARLQAAISKAAQEGMKTDDAAFDNGGCCNDDDGLDDMVLSGGGADGKPLATEDALRFLSVSALFNYVAPDRP